MPFVANASQVLEPKGEHELKLEKQEEEEALVKEEKKAAVKEEMEVDDVAGKAYIGIPTIDISTMTCTMHGADGDQVAPLEPGPQKLLIAKFGDYVHTTELSNLMLHAKPTPKAKKVRKKPGAAPALDAEATVPAEAAPAPAAAAAPPPALEAAGPAPAPEPAAAAEAAPAPEDATGAYTTMWYDNKAQKTIAIRKLFGDGKQVLQFGGKKNEKTKEEMEGFAKLIIKDLKDGMAVDAAKQKGLRLCGLARE